MIAKVLITFGVLFAAPFCMGLLPVRFMPGEEQKKDPLAVYLAGFLLSLAVSNHSGAGDFNNAMGICADCNPLFRRPCGIIGCRPDSRQRCAETDGWCR